MNNCQGQYGTINQAEGFQGRYGESQQNDLNISWVCPNCETNNTGSNCALCGYSQEKHVSSKNKLKKWIVAIMAFVFVGTVAVFLGTSNARKYNYANNLLLQGQFDEAISLFTELEDYKDSKVMCAEAYYVWAEVLLEKNRFDDALNKLGQIPEYEKTSNLKLEVYYQKALAHLEKSEYAAAYSELSKLPAKYKNASTYLKTIVKIWGGYIIEKSHRQQAVTFAETVTLSQEESAYLYEHLINKDYYMPSSLESSMREDFLTRSIILNALTNDIPNEEALKKLFSEFESHRAEEFIKENYDLFVELWNLPVVQNIINAEWNICVWLLGNWKANNGQYIKFYQKKNDTESIWSDHTLPWTAKPSGTAHWSIVDLEYVWTDKDNNELAKVYRFKFVGPDAMEVYCYKNDKTYTLYRSK